MRKFFVLMIALILTVPSLGIAKDNEEFHKMMSVPGNYLGFQILAIEAGNDKNYIISPTSLAIALSMLSDGADEGTKAEIIEETFISDAASAKELQKSLCDSGIHIANALFARNPGHIQQEYAECIKDNYNAELFTLEGIDKYNNWVNENTHGLIKKALDSIDSETELILSNVSALDLQWEKPFEAKDTFEGDFFTDDEQVKQVQYLHQEFRPNEVKYMEKNSCQAIKLNYKDSDLYMIIASVGSVSSFWSDLVFKGIGYFDDLDYVDDTVILNVPKFDVSSDTLLKNALQEIGICRIFESDKHFEKMYSGTEDIKVDNILQKARVQMDESGTKAAAVTTILLETSSIKITEDDPIIMNADHPFVFIIADEKTNSVCFAGVIADPQ